MKVRINLFAVARQIVGSDYVEVEVDGAATIGDVRRRLAECVPELSSLLPLLLFAVDAEYAGDETRLSQRSDVACIPPVSGG